jgi:hypothetical protein
MAPLILRKASYHDLDASSRRWFLVLASAVHKTKLNWLCTRSSWYIRCSFILQTEIPTLRHCTTMKNRQIDEISLIIWTMLLQHGQISGMYKDDDEEVVQVCPHLKQTKRATENNHGRCSMKHIHELHWNLSSIQPAISWNTCPVTMHQCSTTTRAAAGTAWWPPRRHAATKPWRDGHHDAGRCGVWLPWRQ